MTRYTKALLVVSGTLSVTIGIVGMVVPLLPTTPFLLLAAYCYSRSSPRFHNWLLGNRYLGAYIDNYRRGLGMAPRDKVVSVATLWATLGVTALTAVTRLPGRLLLLAVAVGVTAHIVRLRTYRPESSGVGLAGKKGLATLHESSGTAGHAD